MKIVIEVPNYTKEQVDDGKGEELGIPLWLCYGIANGTPLPKGHGRLIDADAFIQYECGNCDGFCDNCDCDCLNCNSEYRCDFIKHIDSANVIIEADKEGAEE